MSQGNNNNNHTPILGGSEPVTYFDPQTPHFTNGSFPQWPQMQGSRTMASSIPSPTSSIHTSMTAPPAPTQRASSHLSMSSNRSHRQHRVNPGSASALLVPPGSFTRPTMDTGNETFDRFYNDQPWSTERLRTSSIAAGRSPQPSSSFQMYREDGTSDLDSIARSDSGYHTHYARSIISNEPEHVNQELPPEMTLQVGNMNVRSAASSEPTEVFPLQSDQASQYSGRSGRSKEFTCHECGDKSKCKSDHKKHMLKHEKPFRCDIKNCRRKGKGFTTVNDLARHKKSVHGIGQYQNSYQCASENCRNKAKIWPRLDNFKQHIQRMHKEDDEADLINRSIFEEAKTPTDIAMDPTLIAGIGIEKQFPDNDLGDPIMSLTPEQDPNPWNNMDVGPGDFNLNVSHVHTALPRLIIPGSGSDDVHSNKPQAGLGTHSPSPRIQPQNDQFPVETLSPFPNRRASPSRPDLESRPRLSNAPQTKAEQQKRAIHHELSKRAQNSSSPSVPAELEDRVLQILYGATGAKGREGKSSLSVPSASNESEVVTLTKDDLLRASQTISNLIKQNKKATLAQNRRPSRSGSSEPIICEICGTTLARSCDMKKHMKRHTRPYGCTYPRCHKRFGAKSDWKRHENSQHYQQETFRCQRISPSTQTLCAELFLREQDFRKHLEKSHKINPTKEELKRELHDCRIGRNGQGQFWCGFCEKIVKLTKERNAAWDERFDHIDSHFNKEKKRIENWLCLDAKKKKGEVYRDLKSSMLAPDESEGSGNGEPDETPSPDAGGATAPATTAASSSRSHRNVQDDHDDDRNHDDEPSASALMATYISESSRKRRAPEGGSAVLQRSAKRARHSTWSRYCCACNNGPWGYSTYVHCMLCNHELCDTCIVIDHVATEGICVGGEEM